MPQIANYFKVKTRFGGCISKEIWGVFFQYFSLFCQNFFCYVPVKIHSGAADACEEWLYILPHPCKSIIINIFSSFLYWTTSSMCGPLILVNSAIASSAHRSNKRWEGKEKQTVHRLEATFWKIKEITSRSILISYTPGLLAAVMAYSPSFSS